MRKLGVVIIAVGNRLRIAPPLVIKEEDLWKGVDILEEALSKLIYVDDI
jgi:4-aminobutyrate aminotransferase-like enzyme